MISMIDGHYVYATRFPNIFYKACLLKGVSFMYCLSDGDEWSFQGLHYCARNYVVHSSHFPVGSHLMDMIHQKRKLP